jgi:RHS repeat-associated protein
VQEERGLFTDLTFGPNGNLFASFWANAGPSPVREGSVNEYDRVTGAFIRRFALVGDNLAIACGCPQQLVFGPDGHLYVAAMGNVMQFNGSTGMFMQAFAAPRADGVAFGPDEKLYVSTYGLARDYSGGEVLKFEPSTGQLINVFVPAGTGGLGYAHSIQFGPDGQLYASDTTRGGVLRFDGVTGSFIDVFVSRVAAGASGDGLLGPINLIFGRLASRAPTILQTTPNSGVQGQSNLAVTIVGRDTHFLSDTTVVDLGTGVTINTVDVIDAETLVADVSIAPDAVVGTRTLRVTTGAETASLVNAFVVNAAARLTGISPDSGTQGQSGQIAIEGSGTHFIQGTTQVSMGPGITVASVTVSCATCLEAQISVADDALVGSRDVVVTTGAETVTLTKGFTVLAAAPILSSVEPTSGRQGQVVTLNVTGRFTHFAQGTTSVSLGGGTSTVSIAVASATSLSAEIRIEETANPGARTLTVTTETEVLSVADVFTVTAAPSLTRIDATPVGTVTLTKGQTVQFRATGTFSDGSVQDPLAGVTWNAAPATVASITSGGVATGIGPGNATISASKGGVQSTPTTLVVKPTPVGLFAPIFAGATVVDGAAAEPSASVQVFVNGLPRGTPAIANAAGEWVATGLTPALAMGDAVTAKQTANGVQSDESATVIVSPGTPVLKSIQPTTGIQGQQNLNVTITGEFTHFAQGVSQVSFAGTAITVNTVTVASATSLTANISIALNANSAPRTVTVTTGAEIVSLPNAFVVQPATNEPPAIDIQPTWAVALPSRLTITYAVTDDGLPIGGALTVSWEKISGPGDVGFQNQTLTSVSVGFSQAGTYVLRIAATDTQFTVEKNITVAVTGTPPSAPTGSITSPGDGAEVTGPTSVVGSVSSAALASWTLEFRMQNEPAFRTIATGTTTVTNASLGTLDPTVLLNGFGLLRLHATDLFGQTTTVGPVTVVISGNQKVGNFTVSFNDLSVPLAGIPIQVVRSYDSRRKTNGDFGIGWRLDLKTAEIAANRIAGEHWVGTSTGGLFPTYCVVEARPHIVTFTIADGTVYQFKPRLTPACQQLSPPQEVVMDFVPISTTPLNATLEPVGNRQLFVSGGFPGPLDLFDFDQVSIFDPRQFRLTLPDGRVLQVSASIGLERISDLNGNSLTITPGAITHSSGKSVLFERDALGRITRVTDPAGNTLRYGYDTAGDLVTFTNRESNTSTYEYDARHTLLTIRDPRGIQPIRNEYDDSGRLIRHIDAFGKEIVYTHRLDTRQEIVTDRLGNTTVNEYDGRGNVVRVTDPAGGTTDRTYDARDNMLTEKDPLGRTRTYTYDAQDNRLTETDALGQLTTFTYNTRQQVLTVRDPRGKVTTNAYDSAGNLTSVTDASGGITRYAYDTRGLQTSMTDPLGNVTTSAYDSSGNLTRLTDPFGHATVFAYDSNGNRVSETRTRSVSGTTESIVTTYQYDREGRLVKTTFADGATTQTAYDAIGKRSRTTDQHGRETTYEYDQMGRLTKTTFPDGFSESVTYDAEGRRTAATDRAGRETTYTYDAWGRQTRTTFPDATTTETVYDAAGQVLRTIDARGSATAYGYDDAGRRTSVTDALGNVTTFAFDAAGNQISIRDANGNTTRFEYDDSNRRIRTIHPDNTSDSVAYDALGRTTAKTDQAGRTTRYEYDSHGRLIAVVDALNQRTAYAYDELGNRISQTDALGRVTRFTYDGLGRRTRRTLPLGMSETFAYDPAGSLASKTDFNGHVTTYEYDSARRLTAKTADPAFNAAPITFSYNAAGQRTQMVDPSGTTTYSYDLRNRLTAKATPQGTLTYTYDAAGNLTSMRSSNTGGTWVDYAYDVLNRLSTVTDNRLENGVTKYTYDNAGNLANFTYPNGVTHTYTYNTLNRLTNLRVATATSTHASYAYNLGPSGNRTAVVELDGRRVDYTYDNLYRLTAEAVTGGPGGTTTYSYDPVGNRLARSSPTLGTALYTYDTNDRLTTDGYDANGNTTGSAGAVYAYDFENRLVSQNNGAVTIVYDGDGNRVAKTVGGVTTQYVVDDLNLTGYAQVLEEVSAGTVALAYTYGINRISQSQASGTSFYGYDGHGSVRLLANEAATVTDRYDYDAFGNVVSQAGRTPNVYLYSGEHNDTSLGLLYLRQRYLSLPTGRFLTLDPFAGRVSDPQTLHKYAYVKNNPTNLVDPTGLDFEASYGRQVEQEVNSQYLSSHPNVEHPFISFGQTLGRAIGPVVPYFALKPDILNYSGFLSSPVLANAGAGRSTWLEIKPLSISGIAKGVAKMSVVCAVLCPESFAPEFSWDIPNPTINVGGRDLILMNVGGIIFYTDIKPEDVGMTVAALAAIKTVEEARKVLRAAPALRNAVSDLSRIRQMIIAGNVANQRRFLLPPVSVFLGIPF